MYRLLKQEGNARRGEFITNRGTVQTPAFMNVATAAAIKGAVSAEDLGNIGCQIMLSNTYHLHVRRRGYTRLRRSSQIHNMGGSHSYRFGRVSGVFLSLASPYYRGGRYLCFAHRRQKDFYGTRREYDRAV